MKSWQINQYGGIDNLTLNESAEPPLIVRPSDVLVEVKAVSVNPIDNLMIGGYGSAVFTKMRKLYSRDFNLSEFPLSPGRDFSGRIIDIGSNVDPKFKLDDEVFGTVHITYQGSFSQYILVSSTDIAHKPQSLKHSEAASFPYVASTIWNSVFPICNGNTNKRNQFENSKVLVLGGSGGVGSFAIQFFSACGAEVTTTVSADFVARAAELGACNVIDYKKPDVSNLMEAFGRYDLILDLVSTTPRSSLLPLLRSSFSSRYITLVLPFFHNIRDLGLAGGSVKTVSQLAYEIAEGLSHGAFVWWGTYAPNSTALEAVSQLVAEKKMQPVIERVFSFEKVPEALTKVMMGHNRGKTVIDFEL